ncbi:MAG: 30S ribosomal protein S14 [Arsenicicoccus sp.]|uniref:30S ribosomal protein S14 n=1 Tax=Serinicoccus profundi TaxID=1078471 RepID=UPI00030A94FE|nr:30S ribosomal protein S14 [Serinicoccus profundi]PZU48528.1 MAG: 30S ribosomal protein S14 [Arsenicicoccus sp.]
MAKKSKIAAQRRREQVVARYAERRAELKELLRVGSPQERAQAQRDLQRLPRDASPTRLRHRDAVDGRPRGYIGKVGLSRVRFRALAHRGELPGITKSSW